MSHITNEIDVLKQLFSNLSEQDKQKFLVEISTQKQTITKMIQRKIVSCCSHCQSKHFMKNDKIGNNQCYLFLDCRKTFVEGTGTAFFQTKKKLATLEKYVHCMIEKYSLRKCAKICDINFAVAFAWRHKILDALQKMMEEVELYGFIQADEIFTAILYKGHHKDCKLPRLLHKRGTAATKLGFSKQQVCVPVGVNLNGLSIAKVAKLGRPCLADLQKVLDGRIAKESIFVTDSLRSYQKLSLDMKLNHIHIPRNKRKVGMFNIQTVNGYHSRLKESIIHCFKGVANKYLNNYLVYHNFVNFAKDTQANKEVILFDFIRNTPCIRRSMDIAKRPAISV
ncbi:IS1595 family transposase [Bartonella sp. MR30HLJHH]|uniref:IS1595 family transposase n=1 Tax=Bartonella sp. MR30HLJHH TaxID=3243557 RepID=UPI0035CF166E